jgi:hypothetical protein
MMRIGWRTLALIGTSALLLTACLASSPRGCGDVADPAALRRLSTTTDSTVQALRTASDSQAKALSQYLQSVVDRVWQLDQCGLITSPADLQTAARLGLTASQLGAETLERTYRWSRRAVIADTANRSAWRTMAAAWDQWQVVQKRPQWFATVIACTNTPDGRCLLAPIDTTRVTEPQRAELGLRTLLQQRELVDSLNRTRARP